MQQTQHMALPHMKQTLLLLICHSPLTLLCQEVIQGPWKMQYGVSTNSNFKQSSALNFRYLSPRFKSTNNDWTEEMEKHPEKYKNTCFMFELIYMPPIKVVCAGVNLQYRLLKRKRLSLDAYGGLKFIIKAPPGYIPNVKLKRVIEKSGWYVNIGAIFRLDLGIIAPFADISYDGLITAGAEFNFHAIYRKPKKRYNLHKPS